MGSSCGRWRGPSSGEDQDIGRIGRSGPIRRILLLLPHPADRLDVAGCRARAGALATGGGEAQGLPTRGSGLVATDHHGRAWGLVGPELDDLHLAGGTERSIRTDVDLDPP